MQHSALQSSDSMLSRWSPCVSELDSELSDELLIKARAGERLAQLRFSELATPFLITVSRRSGAPSWEDAEDMAQRVLLDALDPEKPFAALGKTKAWLACICVRITINKFPPGQQHGNEPLLDTHESKHLDHVESLERAEQALLAWEITEWVLAGIDTRYRDAYQLSKEEFMAEYDVRPQTMNAWRRRAKREIARALKEGMPLLAEEFWFYIRKALGFKDDE